MSAILRQALPLASAALLVIGATSAPAAAQESTSAQAARQLASALDAAKLDAIAAADPEDPTRYAAALYFAGSQLLVVSAQYAAPTLLQTKLQNKNYRDIYIDLNSASVAGTKVFIIDTGANGLQAKPDDSAVDSYEDGQHQLTLDGDWRAAKMREEEYMKIFAEGDARYARILGLLTAQVRGSGTP
jgi:type II secretory pathway pseudopilin PulG